MAITLWWLGHATQNTARVCVRTTTTGNVTVACAGTTYTVAADTAVNDGVVVADVLGLLPGQTYPVVITDASAAVERGTLRTMPATGGKVAFISCEERTRPQNDMAQNIIAFGANAVVNQGDYIYTGAWLSTYNGESSTLPATGSAASVYATHWRQMMRRPDKRLLETTLPHYRIWDDHEFGGDNWSHTVADAQAGGVNVASGGTQAEVDASWWAARQAAGWYTSGNAPADAGTIAEKPSNAAAGTSVSQYPVAYHRFTVGDIEIFVIDCISYRSPNTATDNASKTMLGANQKAWLKARLAASTAKFKIIASSKTTYFATTNGVADDWTRFSTERNELIDFIRTTGVTGCAWICGDAHSAFTAYVPSTGHIAVCANPAGVNHIAQTAALQPNVIWKQQPNGGQTDLPGVFGLAEASGDTLTLRIIDQYGAELWRGTVQAGTNVLTA